jgi:FADH2 O2-dependent halogenase
MWDVPVSPDFDLAIVGSGFGGSLLAMIARRLGLRVVLLERGKHPRFAIGESTSPLTNLLLEELAVRYELPRLLPLTEFGPWKRTYPDVTCGLKRGFTYYHHEAGKPFGRAADRSDQLLVAASPHDEVSDMHWLRADVDKFLMYEAVAVGAEYQDETLLDDATFTESCVRLTGTRRDTPVQISARLLVDASGPRGFLSRALELSEKPFQGFPRTQALFSHFIDVRRCDQMEAFSTDGTPPYPPDDAALHHVFDGGWMWVLRFDNGVTSAGVSVTDDLALELGLADGEAAWPRVLERFPSVGEQFEAAKAILPFIYSPRLSYRCTQAAGDGWAMLPSAAAFVDPLFSTGFPLTLLGISRLGLVLEEAWGSKELRERLHEYGEATFNEADWTAKFVGGCFSTMDSFPHFAAFSMFYFAAASFSEMARRVGRPDLASSFLARTNRTFAEGLEAAAELLSARSRARLEPAELAQTVCGAVESINIAGLCRPEKRNWHGVDLEDVVRGSEKLGLKAAAMREIIRNSPWARGPDSKT